MFGKNYQELADSYNALGAMLESGVDLINVLTFQEKSGADRVLASRLLLRIKNGSDLSSALSAERFPPLEVALVKAGEETGELAVVFKRLSQYYSERSIIARNLKAALAKPMVLFSVSVVCTALPPYILGSLSTFQFLSLTALPIALVTAIIVTLFDLVWRATRNPKLDRWIDRKFHEVRFGRALTTPIAEERFFVAFTICIKAGTSLDTLIKTLEIVSQHPSMSGATRFLKSTAESKGIAAALERSGHFTHDQIAGMRVGEVSGRLEQQLEIIVKELRGQIDYRLKVFKEWAPRILYGLIAAFVAFNILAIAFRKG